MTRFIGLPFINPSSEFGGPTPGGADVRAIDVRNICWLFHRIRKWNVSGTAQILGSPDAPVSFSYDFQYGYPGSNSDEADTWVNPLGISASQGTPFGTIPEVILAVPQLSYFTGPDQITDWAIPAFNIGLTMTDSVGTPAEIGYSGVTGGSPSAHYTIFVTGTNLVEGVPFSHILSPIQFANFGAFADVVGSCTLSPKEYWPYQDASGTPLYNTTTGALL